MTAVIDTPRASRSPEPEQGRNFLRSKKFIGGALISLSGLGFVGYQTLSSDKGVDLTEMGREQLAEAKQSQNGDISDGDTIRIIPERPAGMSIDTADPTDFYKYFSQEERVSWANEQLNMPSDDPNRVGMTILEAKWQELAAKFNNPTQMFLAELGPNSESMSGDQILARFTVIANILAETESEDQQLKLLSALYDPSNADLFNTAQNKILNGENLGLGTSAVRTDAYDTRLESPVFTTADPGNGYRANGVPSKIMSVGGDDGSVAQDTVRFYKGIPVLYNVSVDFSDQVQHPELISAQ